jgi:hypothetical protein
MAGVFCPGDETLDLTELPTSNGQFGVVYVDAMCRIGLHSCPVPQSSRLPASTDRGIWRLVDLIREAGGGQVVTDLVLPPRQPCTLRSAIRVLIAARCRQQAAQEDTPTPCSCSYSRSLYKAGCSLPAYTPTASLPFSFSSLAKLRILTGVLLYPNSLP